MKSIDSLVKSEHLKRKGFFFLARKAFTGMSVLLEKLKKFPKLETLKSYLLQGSLRI